MVTNIEKKVNSGKLSKRRSRAKLEKQLILLWKTDNTLFKIAKIVHKREPTVKTIFINLYGDGKVKERSRKLYQKSKLGKNNPMFGKFGDKHHNFVGRASDKKGYYTVLKPEWWTGKNKGTRIFEHRFYAAIKYGITEIPKGWVIHHLDCNSENNNYNNLLLMMSSAHIKLHWILRRV